MPLYPLGISRRRTCQACPNSCRFNRRALSVAAIACAFIDAPHHSVPQCFMPPSSMRSIVDLRIAVRFGVALRDETDITRCSMTVATNCSTTERLDSTCEMGVQIAPLDTQQQAAASADGAPLAT